MSFNVLTTPFNAKFNAPTHIPDRVFKIISGFSLKFANSSTMRFLKSSIDVGGAVLILSPSPIEKTSHGL